MKSINKKGITLVELLTVLIVLILVFLIAVIKVNDVMDETEKNSVKANAISYMKAVNDLFTLKNGSSLYPVYEGYYEYSDLTDMGVRVSGTKPLGGYVFNVNNKTVYGCLRYKGRRAIIENNTVTIVDNKKCTIKSGYNSTMKAYFSNYKGTEDTFTIPVTGKYKIEAWGAQGGSLDNTYVGGYGAYSSAYVVLDKDDVLYINVGGKGTDLAKLNNGSNSGGYNGGGASYAITTNCSNYAGPGGGATSISLVSGLLNTLESNQDKILIVAGGGGGSTRRNCNGNDYNSESGGSGGGYIGGVPFEKNGLYTGTLSTGGTQTEGGFGGKSGNESGSADGSFGQGGYTTRTGGYTNSPGGGGGLYGGGNAMFLGAAGGSGYIGNSALTYGVMYCYQCDTSDVEKTRTISTTNVSDKPLSFYAKKGNGYARILLIEEINLNNNP